MDQAGVTVMLAATLFVAITAFRLAYAGSKGAALDAGLSRGDAAWYPLCVEGVLVVAAVATAMLRGVYPWVVLLAFSGLSIGANLVHAVDQPGPCNWFILLVAGIPPAALPLCVEMSTRSVRRLSRRRTLRATTVRPDPLSDPEPDSPSGLTGPPAGLILVATETAPPDSGQDSPDWSDRAVGETPQDRPTRHRTSAANRSRRTARRTVPGGRRCESGCGRTVSRSVWFAHKKNGCPEVAR
jgi:Protein of unknown function (DUF2637)